MDAVARAVDGWVAAGQIPSASVVVRVAGDEVLHHTAGLARLEPPRPARPDEVYDLASVTKALGAATVAAGLIQGGALQLDAPTTRWGVGTQGMTPRLLLAHCAGTSAWAPLYEDVPRALWGSTSARESILRAAAALPLESEPGTQHRYSDVGFLVLLAVLEAAGGARIDALLAPSLTASEVDLRWGWTGAAATEDCPVRRHVVEGEVHDLNAAAMGGVSSHAGLFGTARHVATFAEALLDAAHGRRDDLPGAGLAALWSTRGLGSHRGGWDGVSTGYTSTGRWWPSDGVGHLGYTGTSVWVAPRHRVVVALLTNRVHPTDDTEAIRAGRPRIHDAVAEALGWDRAGS